MIENKISTFKSNIGISLRKSLLPTLNEPSFAYGGGASGFMVGGNMAGSGVYVTPSTVRQISSVAACINILCEDVSKIPFNVEEFNSKSGWTPILPTSPLGNIVKFPNERFTMKEIIRQCIDDLIMNGNAYIVIIRNDDMSLSELIYVNYNAVSVYENEDGNLIYSVTSKLLNKKKTSLSSETGYTRTITHEDIIHLKRNVINGEYIGRGLIYTSSEVFGLAMAAQETASRTFNNGCTLTGYLKTDQPVNAETASRIKHNFMEAQGGVSKSGTPAIMSGVEFVKLALSPEEVQLEETRNYMKTEIASMLRIPLYKLAVEVSGESSTLEQQELAYIHSTLSFYTDMITEEFNRKVFDRADMGKFRFNFDFTTIAMPDFKTRMDTWATARSVGLVTSDYIAARENLPIPGPEGFGDTYCLPMNLGTMNGKDDTDLGVSGHTVQGQDNEQTPNPVRNAQ